MRMFIAIAIYVLFKHFDVDIVGWDIVLLVWGNVCAAQDLKEMFRK